MGIDWDKRLETGIRIVDSQHKEIFSRISSLLDSCHRGKGREEAARLMDFLGNYVIEHFESEEKHMLETGYPGYEKHREMHQNFLRDYIELKRELDTNGATLTFVLTINRKIVEWARTHISKADKDFVRFLENSRA